MIMATVPGDKDQKGTQTNENVWLVRAVKGECWFPKVK